MVLSNFLRKNGSVMIHRIIQFCETRIKRWETVTTFAESKECNENMYRDFKRMSTALTEFDDAQENGSPEHDTGKMETSLCSMKIEEEIMEETSEIDKRKKLWESEQVRLKELCCLEDTEPWEINRLAQGITSSEKFRDFTPLTYIAGTDISFVKDNETNACAAIVVVELPNLEVVYEDISIVELTAPYIPGFLAFREADFLIKKLEQLQKSKPDLMPQAIIVDGNGILHPREFGLACRIGVHMGIPTVIAAKTLSRVDGIKKNEDHQDKVKALLKKGDQFPLVGQSGQTLGVALRSCDKSTIPVYISPGHNISMETAVWLVQLCCKTRIPEPVRQADIKSRQYIRDNWKSDVVCKHDTGKMETSLCSMKTEEEILEETSEIDKTKILWESEQVRLKELCCLEDTEPWEINRLAQGITSSEEFTDFTPLTYIAGTDISFVKDNETNACAAIVVVELPNLEVVYEDISMVELTAPYIPGFLAFREADFLIKKLEQLQKSRPDLMPQAIIVDGNGILHPREFGLACHIGVQMGIPTVGAAKTLYHVDGIEKNEDHQSKIKALLKKGDQFPLVGQSGQTLGVALRSCDKSTNPVYISPGHNISMETAVWLVQLCCKYRVPEPVRQADIKSRQYIRDNWKSDVA